MKYTKYAAKALTSEKSPPGQTLSTGLALAVVLSLSPGDLGVVVGGHHKSMIIDNASLPLPPVSK